MSCNQTADFLRRQRAGILDRAATALGQSGGRHYEAAGADTRRLRLEVLYDQMVEAAAKRDLGKMLDFTRQLAKERFTAGYDLSEIQIAFNTLEEATWADAFAELHPDQLAETLGLVSTILGAAKDALAREYVALATRTRVPSLDLRLLFAGVGPT